MEQCNNAMGMLDLMVRPAFCVQDGVIVRVNQAAERHTVTTGTEITGMLVTGAQEYADFTDGCLYLTVSISGHPFGASVTRMEGFDVFVLEQEADQAELQAMALAARELRRPLTSVMTVADRLFPVVGLQEDPAAQEQIARINRGLFQMLRIISNMSDAAQYTGQSTAHLRTQDIRALFDEIFDQAGTLIRDTGVSLHYSGLSESVYCLVDADKIERAVYNILSNAVKFSPKGGRIEARLTQRGNKLYLTVQDSGPGVSPKLRGSVYSRYLREPGVEDERYGIGLGMVLVRAAAALHGGTVLMQQPEGCGARVTMTLTLRQNPGNSMASNILHVDYAGERNHGLIELSDSLPSSLYDSEKVN